MSGKIRAGSIGRKLATACLVLALFSACPGLDAKEKKGARIEVECRVSPREYRSDQRLSRRLVGELIAVRSDSLLLVEEYSEFAHSIDVRDILRVKVLNKKSPATIGLYGAVAGLCAGLLLGGAGGADKEDTPGAMLYLGAMGATAGGLAGFYLGHITTGKSFEFAGRTAAQVQEMLARLSYLARVGKAR
jgi:hypothetical protein